MITLTTLPANGEYYVDIVANALTDIAGNTFAPASTEVDAILVVPPVIRSITLTREDVPGVTRDDLDNARLRITFDKNIAINDEGLIGSYEMKAEKKFPSSLGKSNVVVSGNVLFFKFGVH